MDMNQPPEYCFPTMPNIEVPHQEVLADLCFVCLQVPQLDNFLDLATIYDEDYNLTYCECFTICTQIDLKENRNLPQNLCKSCGLELQISYDFYKKIDETKRYLQEYHQLEIRSDHYDDDGVDERSIKQQTEGQDSESQTNENEPLLVDSSQFVITDEIDNQDEEVVDFNGRILENVNMKSDEQLERTESQELLAETIDGGSYVKVDDERVANIDGCLILEEHLEAEDFNNAEERLDEEEETERETPLIKPSENSNQMEFYQIEASDDKFVYIHNDDSDYTNCQPDAAEQRETSPKNQNKKDFRSWQENVVAVANKEHLPLENENDDDNSDIEYEVIHTITEDDITTDALYHHEKDNASGGEKRPRKRRTGMYSCDYCFKVYPNYSRMMTHRRSHLTDKPNYSCSYCSRIYATKQAMECHIQTAHDKTGYNCTICDKVFAIRRSLEVHMRFHLGNFPYACNLCDRKFAQLGHLNTHKNVKHNNVRFSCDYPNCGKFFTSSASLRNHEFTHSNMPFECMHCQRGYPCKSKLKVHIKLKHSKEPSPEELESMRKFHVMRSKLNLVQVVSIENET